MITLRVVLDDMLTPQRTAPDRGYTAALVAAIVDAAPSGCEVRGIVAASPEPDYLDIARRLPGLAGLDKSAFERRELQALWRRGIVRPPRGALVHAPSLFAPLARHDRINDGTQLVATIHDATAWTDPALLSGRDAAWQRAMGDRARRHADAIVVPSHAVADALADVLGVADRLRVIAGAPLGSTTVPHDADERARRLGLPARFVLGIGSRHPSTGIDRLIAAMRLADAPSVPLVIVGDGDEPTGATTRPDATASPDPTTGPDATTNSDAAWSTRDDRDGDDRVLALGPLDDDDLATVIDRASVVAVPNRAAGFGLELLTAMRLGAPVVHAAVPTLDELAGGAGLRVELDDADDAPAALAEALRRVVDDEQLAARLAVTGVDRSTAFTWRGAADQVWRLHADL